jgi:hypothetical protein
MEYQRAFEHYHANPASLVTTAFLDRAIVRLEEAYRQPRLFELRLVALSPAACEALASGKHLAEEFLIRHKNGDWGLTEWEDAAHVLSLNTDEKNPRPDSNTDLLHLGLVKNRYGVLGSMNLSRDRTTLRIAEIDTRAMDPGHDLVGRIRENGGR